MPLVSLRETVTLGRVIAREQLLRSRGSEDGFTMKFEAQVSKKIGVKHALTVNSGTSALISALVCAGIGPRDEVLVPAYTWVATAAAPLALTRSRSSSTWTRP